MKSTTLHIHLKYGKKIPKLNLPNVFFFSTCKEIFRLLHQIKEWKDELADYEKTMEQVYGPETFEKIIRL